MFASIVVLRYASRNPYLQQLGQSYLSLLVINPEGHQAQDGVVTARVPTPSWALVEEKVAQTYPQTVEPGERIEERIITFLHYTEVRRGRVRAMLAPSL